MSLLSSCGRMNTTGKLVVFIRGKRRLFFKPFPFLCLFLPCKYKPIIRLKAGPDMGRNADNLFQLKSGIRGNGFPTLEDGTQFWSGSAHAPGQLVLGHVQVLEYFLQIFAGRNRQVRLNCGISLHNACAPLRFRQLSCPRLFQ